MLIYDETDENETLAFAKALVECRGDCYKAEKASEIYMWCSRCPFYCKKDAINMNRIAWSKAERYLLDLEVRNIMESI